MATKTIEIGLEVSQAIEMCRIDFKESENDILERIFRQFKSEIHSYSEHLRQHNNDLRPGIQATKQIANIEARYSLSSPKHKKDVQAYATNSGSRFIVLKDSRVSTFVNNGCPKHYQELRQELIDKGVINRNSRLFTRDHEFSSQSAASSVILGTSSNGLRDWKLI